MTNIVLESISEAREELVLVVQKGCTPKAARSGGSKVGTVDSLITKLRNTQEFLTGKSESLDSSIELLFALEVSLQELPWNSESKARDAIDPVIDKLTELGDKADKEKPQASARLPELEAEIAESLRVSADALVQVGHLLNEARGEFSSANEFLAWSGDRFEFKKAYVYRLMKVADEFATDDELAGQSINVLHKLAGFPEEVKQAARELVAEGETLTGKAVEKMAGVPQPVDESKEPALPMSTTVDNGLDLGQDEGAPWSPATGRDVSIGGIPTAVPDSTDPEVLKLRELVSELQSELAAARQERESKGKSKAVVPALPQFQSDCMYARLGLSAEQAADPAEVRKVFRAMVKLGYSSQHESYALLLEAKDTLMPAEAVAA